jgi:hypothetical protein
MSFHFLRRDRQRPLEGGSRQIVVIQLEVNAAQPDIGLDILRLQAGGAPVCLQRFVPGGRGAQCITQSSYYLVFLRRGRQCRLVSGNGFLRAVKRLVDGAQITIGRVVRRAAERLLVRGQCFLVATVPVVNARQAPEGQGRSAGLVSAPVGSYAALLPAAAG